MLARYGTRSACLMLAVGWLHASIAQPTTAFTDITTASGINFVHRSDAPAERYLLHQIMGSGAALFDYDNDGDLDIYLINSIGPNQLFRQTRPLWFEDTGERSGVQDAGYGMGAAIGDYDDDGDLDVFVSNRGPDRLYQNEGDGTYSDVTDASGIDSPDWSTSAAFCDIDADGDLDLYVTAYVRDQPPQACHDAVGLPDFCGPNTYRGVPDVLYRNNGDGTFDNVSVESGISRVARNGLGVVCFDFNGDGRSDILVANDGEENLLWINRGAGSFHDDALPFGVAVNLFGDAEAGMGIALGDVDGDGRLDVLMTHLDQETHTLYRANAGGGMTDASAVSGMGVVSMTHTGFGTEFFDADQDGDLDIAVAIAVHVT